MEINGFVLSNTVKLERVQEKFVGADESTILVEYDRLGGLITKGGQKVKSGCFYDFKTKKAFPEPKVVFVYSVNGRIVDVPEGTQLPGEVRAAQILEATEKEARTKSTKKKATRKPEVDEDEGDDE